MSPRSPHPTPAFIAWLVVLAASSWACSPAEEASVAIVVNDQSPVSLAIGERYADQRGIPGRNLVRLSIPVEDPLLGDARHETISRDDFDRLIRAPLEAWLAERGDAIRILVTTKGIPLRVSGDAVEPPDLLRDATAAAVDAELAVLFSPLVGSSGVATSRNPYFDDARDFQSFRRASPDAPLRYLVARLTGYADDPPTEGVPRSVARLIETARAPLDERGLWLVDRDPSLPPAMEVANTLLLAPAAATTAALGLRMVEDARPEFVADAEPIQAYASWGSNDGHEAAPRTYGEIDGHRYPGRFAERALAVDLVSTNARTFSRTDAYSQSLIADLVEAGVGGVAGHVDEPTLPAVARPHILMRHYASGRPAVEAFYRSIPYLGWMNVYVGDPLMRIERETPLAVPIDRDGDGILDDRDNCRDIPNPRQIDTNDDGFGNLCDADVNGDGIVTTSWGEAFPRSRRGDVEWIALSVQRSEYVPDHDLDGDGRVDERDVSIAQLYLFVAPGPAGGR